jgi:hypothetical protein
MAYNIFTQLSQNDDITSLTGTEVTTGMWSGDTGSLATIFTSSVQVANSGEFYYDLYDLNPTTSDSAEIQFSVAYGHVSGGGSPTLANVNNSTRPTQVIYSQYRNILLAKDAELFTFDQTTSEDIYVLNMQRSRLRQAIDPGNWQLGLSGSNGISTFIDDSGLSTAVVGNLVANNVYNIRSGTIDDGFATGNSTVYGQVFPDYGVIILHPKAICSAVGFVGAASASVAQARQFLTGSQIPFAPYTGSDSLVYLYQHEGLVRAISGSMAVAGAAGDFQARSAETITSTNYFIRLRNNQYNYSNNPTYYTGSNPQAPLPAFRINPITYVTTIGLYNDANELLAVAKLSRPIQKGKDKEALIRVRLDY